MSTASLYISDFPNISYSAGKSRAPKPVPLAFAQNFRRNMLRRNRFAKKGVASTPRPLSYSTETYQKPSYSWHLMCNSISKAFSLAPLASNTIEPQLLAMCKISIKLEINLHLFMDTYT